MSTQYGFEVPGRYARGWHVILFSQELAAGEIKKMHYFDRDFIVFRGEDGQVGALDAYCPHLGAHLGGVGAAVIGNTVRCPFHGWQYERDGSCSHIPYASKIPERARHALRAWTIAEKCGFIAIWHDPENGEPDYELPDIPNWGEEEWGEWRFRRSRIPTQGREIIENMADRAHFAFVHGGLPKKFDVSFDRHMVSQDALIITSPEHIKIVPSSAPDWLKDVLNDTSSDGGHSEGIATYHGPAVMYFYSEMNMSVWNIAFKTFWLNVHVPVNDKEVDLCSGVIMAPLNEGDHLPDEFRELYPEVAHAAFGQDVEIWKDKVYQSNPIFCDADGPIHKLRKWYDQFYQPRQ